jgi:putative transposase
MFQTGGGYIKLTHYLAIERGFYVNHKKIYRLCDENGLLLYKVGKRCKTPKRRAIGYTDITRQNQLWQFDLKYGYVHGMGRHFFVLAFIDVFTKKVTGYYVGLSCKTGDLIFTLNQALKAEGITVEHGLKIRSDNGPQMSSNQFYFYLKKLEQKLSHEFIPPRTPDRNAYIEAFFSILEKEFLTNRYFETFADAYKAVTEFITFYNTRRIHGSLGMRSPMAYINGLSLGQINAVSLKA